MDHVILSFKAFLMTGFGPSLLYEIFTPEC